MTVQAPPELAEFHRRLWRDLQERAAVAAEGLEELKGRATHHFNSALVSSDPERVERELGEIQRLLQLWIDMEQSDVEWPVPEELERPGWDHVRVEPGRHSWRVVQAVGAPLGMDEGEVTAPEPMPTDEVEIEPTLHMEVELGTPPETWRVGLGWNVQHRTAVYFSWPR